MHKIKKDDLVKVITGKDKDKTGKVLQVKDGKVVVEGYHHGLYNVAFLYNTAWCCKHRERRYLPWKEILERHVLVRS